MTVDPKPRTCPDCRCSVRMHFFDGCHTAFGFICRCTRTRDDLTSAEESA